MAALRSVLPCATALVLASGTARAEGDAARAGEAERLFREGRALMDAGNMAAACPKFTESEKLDPAPGTLLSLADCEERSQAYVRAREHYQLAGSGFPKKDPRRAFAAARAQTLDKRVAHLTLRLAPGAPADTVVRFHGPSPDWAPNPDVTIASADLGNDRVVDPGDFRVTVTAKGHADNVQTFNLAEGETREVPVELGPLEKSPPPAARPAVVATEPLPKTPSGRRTLALALLGAGGVGLVVGGITGILAAGKAGTVKDHCTSDYLCDPTGVDAASSGKTFATVSTVGLVAGAVLAGVGAYLFFARPAAKKSSWKLAAVLP
jgi:hypothetical protein